MKLPSCPRTSIINILKKNPDGLTLTSIAQLTGLHRHTATKYVYELKGAGVINERDIGSAKLCYLREGFSKAEERKVVGRLNGSNGWRKSSAGQVQLLSFFVVLFLIPATVIIAHNATHDMNSTTTGELILGQMNTTSETFIEPNQTNPEIQEPATEADITATISEPDETVSAGNQAEVSEGNQTAQEETITQENPTENLTVLNETIANETIQNETESTILPESQTPPETGVEITIPEVFEPVLAVRIISPDKALRGEQFDVSAIASNTGNSDAKNVRLEWVLPEWMEIFSGEVSAACGAIAPDSECMSSITVFMPMSADVGKSEIRVIVRYEE